MAALRGVGWWLVVWMAVEPLTASAIPAFARKYETSCQTCHAGAFPSLNAYGREFQENGLQLAKGAEQPVVEEAALAPNAPWERLQLLREVPVALRAQASASLVAGGGQNGNTLNFRALEGLTLLMGASVFEDISFVAAADVAPGPVLHHAAFGFHNLIGDQPWVNLRFGKLLLLDFLRPGHRELSSVGNPAGSVHLGLNPTYLDNSHLGAEVYGRLLRRKVFYELAVVQGAQGPDGLSDLDAYKDVFGQLQLSHQGFTVGGLGYWGNTQLVDTAQGVAVRFTDRFLIAGGSLEWGVGPVTLFGTVLHGSHSNPTGHGERQDYTSARAQMDIQLARDLVATIRYDAVFAAETTGAKREFLTAHASWLATTNLRVVGEYVSNILDPGRSTFRLGLDLAL